MLSASATLVVTLLLLGVLGGDHPVTVTELVAILRGEQIPGLTFIVMDVTLPQLVLGLLAGSAFGAAGAAFQSTLRNPLASPDILGVSAGASAAGVFAIVALGMSGLALSAAGLAGAVLVALAIRWTAGSDGGHRLILIGVLAAAGLLAVIQYLFTRADEYDAQLALRWMTGSLSGADWPTIRILAAGLFLLFPMLALAARSRRSLELGRDLATVLGAGARSTDRLLLVAVLIVGLGVAAAGPVAFVAFAAGPIARALNGGRTTLSGAALTGAAIVLGAHHVAAYAIPGTHLPVGVVTGAFGAPFLLWLLASGRTERSRP